MKTLKNASLMISAAFTLLKAACKKDAAVNQGDETFTSKYVYK